MSEPNQNSGGQNSGAQNSGDARFDFGMVGLGTMGRALLLNMADKGNAVAGYDTNADKANSLHADSGGQVGGFTDVQAFVASIRRPRAIMVLVPAGKPVDDVLANLSPLLEPGDFVIDGGNSFFKDTDRRVKEMHAKGLGFMGMGVSGGEEGARRGPSMMPGGSPQDYDRVKPILESVAAKYEGEPCVALMGSGSAGHYVKTVHNGIEYAIMQTIAEIYDLLKRGYGKSNEQIADLFAQWNEGPAGGFLVEITSVVLRYKDQETGQDLVDLVSDKAKSKGTGKWTSQDAMDLGMPVPTIDAAVNAREISGYKAERQEAEKIYAGLPTDLPKDLTDAQFESALLAASLLAYAQGLAQIHAGSEEYGYGADLRQVARVWRAGCIIRSRLLQPIYQAFERKPDLTNILLDAEIAQIAIAHSDALRKVVVAAAQGGIPAPSLAAGLAYLDSYRTGRLPANLIQAQRDLFGAHTYERLDRPGSFHTQWESQ